MTVVRTEQLHSQLLDEQAQVQADKFQGRMLGEYNDYLFRDQRNEKPHSNEVVRLARQYSSEGRTSLEGVLDGMYRAKCWPVAWVDMGGGRGLAMREMATVPEIAGKVAMTNVDLFDYGLKGLCQTELQDLQTRLPGLMHPETAPELIMADTQTVQLDEPVDLITSIEHMQYLDDPLGAIVNWYNQLDDNRLLIASTAHEFGASMAYAANNQTMPMTHFVQNLQAQEIPIATTKYSDRLDGTRHPHEPYDFRVLALQRAPNTRLRLCASVVKVDVDMNDYKTPFYDKYAATSGSIVEVIRQET